MKPYVAPPLSESVPVRAMVGIESNSGKAMCSGVPNCPLLIGVQ